MILKRMGIEYIDLSPNHFFVGRKSHRYASSMVSVEFGLRTSIVIVKPTSYDADARELTLSLYYLSLTSSRNFASSILATFLTYFSFLSCSLTGVDVIKYCLIRFRAHQSTVYSRSKETNENNLASCQ